MMKKTILAAALLFPLMAGAQSLVDLHSKAEASWRRVDSLEVPTCTFDAFIPTRYGARNANSRCMQVLLNSSEDTRVAPDGAPGSPGMETDYFGPATLAALKRLQAAGGLNPTGSADVYTVDLLYRQGSPALNFTGVPEAYQRLIDALDGVK